MWVHFWDKGILFISYCPINTKQYEQPQTNFYLLILYYTVYESCLMQSEGISSVVILHLQACSLVKGCTIAARITAVYLHNDIMWEKHNFLIWAVWQGISDGTKVKLLQLEFDLWIQNLIFIWQCGFFTVRKYGSSDKTLWSWHTKSYGLFIYLFILNSPWLSWSLRLHLFGPDQWNKKAAISLACMITYIKGYRGDVFKKILI